MGYVEVFFRYCFIIFAFLIIGIKCDYLFDILPAPAAALGSAGIILLCLFVCRYREKLYSMLASRLKGIENLSYGKMMAVIAAVSLVTKLLAIVVFHIESLNDGSDIDVYVNAAYELGTTGLAVSHAGYLLSFSHMFWFGAFLSPVAGIFGISQTAFSVYLTVILTISSLLLFAAFAEQAGKDKAFTVLLIYNLLPGTILLPQYITHEIALLFFESIAVWLWFRCLPHCKKTVSKVFVFLLFTSALLLAVMMNAAGLVMCIAFIILFFVRMLKKREMKSFMLFAAESLAVILTVSAGTAAADSIQRRHCAAPEDYVLGDKVLWTVYVGGNAEHSGQWNREDADEFSSYDQNLSYEEIQQFRKDKIRERYHYLFSNPAVFGGLIEQKLITVWGVFGYSILYTNENIPDPHLQAVYNTLLDRPLLLLEYAASVLAAAACLAEVLHYRRKQSDYVLLIQLFLMGTTAMLLITECRNKYTIAVQPFFWIACFALSRKTEKTEEGI